ncbi:MAG: carboxylesterase, partial [Alcaligenaceae bacterium]|nr:carboxylesterase [Alcaligenaceae bacterium]
MAMRAWYDIYQPDLVRREDETGLRASENAIRALIEKENARGIPTRNIVLAGFSQGCAMTLQTGLRLPETLAGMVCLSGYLPLRALTAAERHSANQNTPLFMAHGTHDPVVVLPRAQESLAWLQEHGYNVAWHTYPMPHSVSLEEIQAIGAFLKQVLRD